jgi:RND family efflux transporter MFP subunit
MKKGIIIAIVAGFIVVIGGVFYKSTQADSSIEDENNAVKSVKVENVETGYDNTVAFQGVVKGATEVHLAPKAQGRVTNIYKDIGETVYKGQIIATIDGSELWAQTHVAQTGYEAAKDATKKTEDYFDKQVSQAKKGRDLAKEAYEAAKQSGDQEKIAIAKANYEMADKGVSTAKKGRDLQVEMAKGQRDVAESQVVAAQTMASNTQLRAPFTGVLAQSNVEIGSLVSPQMPMFLIVGDAGKEVEISVSSEQLGNLVVGQEVTIRTAEDKKVKAKIAAISPMVDTHTRKGLVKVSLSDDSALVLGEYVRVFLPEENATNEITVPRSALVSEYHDTFVFVVEDNIAHKRSVSVGEDYGDRIVITDGLIADDVIIIEGQQYLNDGDQVEIIE